MFKKSISQGDRTPKRENKDQPSEADPAPAQSASTAEKTTEPASEDKKS